MAPVGLVGRDDPGVEIESLTAGGVDVFNIYASGASTVLTLVGTGATSTTNVLDMSVTGRHLFVSRTADNWQGQ